MEHIHTTHIVYVIVIIVICERSGHEMCGLHVENVVNLLMVREKFLMNPLLNSVQKSSHIYTYVHVYRIFILDTFVSLLK